VREHQGVNFLGLLVSRPNVLASNVDSCTPDQALIDDITTLEVMPLN
jgi:hypothetical protein